ncbi:MAG: ArsR family transcriptional regulator [Halodesulfurarchaeum sp.]
MSEDDTPTTDGSGDRDAPGDEESGADMPEEGEELPAEGEEAVEVETDADLEGGARHRLEEEADRAVSEFDARLVDVLSWVLDTETRGRIFVFLRKHPWSTSEEVAEGTGLYPSTVREALATMAEEDVVERRKRQSEGAGNNPYEYTAIPPSELVGNVVGRVQDELNTLFNMDIYLGEEDAETTEPVSIEVTAGAEDESAEAGGESDAEASSSDQTGPVEDSDRDDEE